MVDEPICIVHRIRFQVVCDVLQCGLCYEADMLAQSAHRIDVRESPQLDDGQGELELE